MEEKKIVVVVVVEKEPYTIFLFSSLLSLSLSFSCFRALVFTLSIS